MINYIDSRRARGEICKANPIGIPMEITNRNDTSNEMKHNVEERQMMQNWECKSGLTTSKKRERTQ